MGLMAPSWHYEMHYFPEADQPRLELWRCSNGGARFNWKTVSMPAVVGLQRRDQVLQELYQGLLWHMELEDD